MFCKNCGSLQADHDTSCSKCGGSLKTDADAIAVRSKIPVHQREAALETALRTDARVRWGILAVIGTCLVLICLAVARMSDSNVSQPAPIAKGPDHDEVPSRAAANKSTVARTPVAGMPEPGTAVASSDPASPAAAHHQRLVDLRAKQEAAAIAIEIEREAINDTLKRDGIEGVPEDEHEQVQRLIQTKESIDAAIREEEAERGSEPPPPVRTVIQTLTHHQVGKMFSIGYWTYRCSTAQWSDLLGNGSSTMGRPDAAFAVIHLTMRNDDDGASIKRTKPKGSPPERCTRADRSTGR